jgi:hypothetical protein
MNYSSISNWDNMISISSARIPTIHCVHGSQFSLSGRLEVLTSIFKTIPLVKPMEDIVKMMLKYMYNLNKAFNCVTTDWFLWMGIGSVSVVHIPNEKYPRWKEIHALPDGKSTESVICTDNYWDCTVDADKFLHLQLHLMAVMRFTDFYCHWYCLIRELPIFTVLN